LLVTQGRGSARAPGIARQPANGLTCGKDHVEQRCREENQEDHDGRDEGRQDIHDGSLNFLRSESAF
jgi:hypothetical protein